MGTPIRHAATAQEGIFRLAVLFFWGGTLLWPRRAALLTRQGVDPILHSNNQRQANQGVFPMNIVKVVVVGLSIIGFSAGTALACSWNKTAQSKKPTVEQTVATNTTATQTGSN